MVERFGAVDAVVNNASLFEHDSVQSFGYEKPCGAPADQHRRADPAGPGAARTCLQPRRATPRDGVVVNLLDQKLWNQNPDFLSYTLSKAALEAANTMLAMALAPQLRVVGVAPGPDPDQPSAVAKRSSSSCTACRRSAAPRPPQDVAAAVKFALENNSITGTTLLVDGGQHLMKFERDFSLM